MSQTIEVSSPELAQDLQRLVDQVDETIQSIRSTIYQLRDSETTDKRPSLQHATVTLAREFECTTGVRPSIAISSQVSSQVPEHLVHDVVYLIKEALHNVRKHAKAKAVSITARHAEHGIEITVNDNGCGFDQTQPAVGHGLETMAERANLIGGQLRITSKIGSGTSVFLTIPSQTTKEQL